MEAALKAVNRTFPEVYESTSILKNAEELPVDKVKVIESDFEFALTHLTPSNRRHVSQYDLVSLQKPQSLLYDLQSSDIRNNLISPLLLRNLIKDSSGKLMWNLLESLIIKICYDEKIHPESFVWRFMCGIGDSLDGFTLIPVDLMSLSTDISTFLNDSRTKGGSLCILIRNFASLRGRESKKDFKSTIIKFMKNLMPGEPIIIMFSSKCASSSVGKDGIVKQFILNSPNETQFNSYSDFVLRSIHRLTFSSSSCEEEFISSVGKPEVIESVIGIEKWRMRLCNELQNNLDKNENETIIEPVPIPDSIESDDLNRPEDFLFK